MKKSLVLVTLIAVLVSACASGDNGMGRESLEHPAPTADRTEARPDPGVVSPDLASEVDQAIADLAERLGDDRIVSVTKAHTVTWPDGSLGCPQPGMMYTQALVDGYRIELTDGESLYQYHGATGAMPFLCENELVSD